MNSSSKYQEKSIEKSIENMDNDARVLSFPYSHEIRSVTGKLGLFSLVMKLHHFLRKTEVNFILALSEKALLV